MERWRNRWMKGQMNIGKDGCRNLWIIGQTYGDTDWMINKQTDGIEERMDGGTEGQMERHTCKHPGRHVGIVTDRQKNKVVIYSEDFKMHLP
jgi:hypothetical protein